MNHSPTSDREGTWPEHCEQRAFVEGMKWWQFQHNGSTAFRSEVEEAESEAIRRYGIPVSSAEDGWIALTPETMPPERERVLADFENHPVEISSWFKWETMEYPLWSPGIREWGRVRRWRKLPAPPVNEGAAE